MSSKWFKNLFLYSVGHTYSNLSRLFLRLFTGILFLQLCIRQILRFDELAPTANGWFGLSPETSMSLLLALGLVSAVCMMLGLLTRLSVLLPLGMMVAAERMILFSQGGGTEHLLNFQPGYPVMFIGVLVYMLLAGPGKISLDYIIAAHFTENHADEEVLDKA